MPKKSKFPIVPTGEQTQITPLVYQIAERIPGERVDYALGIAKYIRSMQVVTDSEGPNFSRTAEEILVDNKYNGCNEAGVVFASLLRAKGIPTTYIQALNIDAVRNFNPDHPSLNGHVFLLANFGSVEAPNIKIINSTSGELTDRLPDNMTVGAEGLDSWDIGLINGFGDLYKLFEQKHQEMLEF